MTITVSGSAATSGIAKYQYSTDGGKTWQDMTVTEKSDATAESPLNVTEAQLIVTDSGTVSYIFRAVSNAGNESAASASVTVNIDKSSPKVFLDGNTTSYLQKDTIEILPTIGYSGIAKMEVKKDGGEWSIISPSADNPNVYYYTVTQNGTYTFRVTNGAGTTATAGITYDKIDGVKPVVAIDSESYSSGRWTNQNVTLSVFNTENNLGTTTFQYKVDNGEWQSYTGSIHVFEETEGTLYTFRATSASGIVSDEVSITVKLDKTAPGGDIKIEQNSIKKFINTITFGLFFNKNVDVTITGNDNLSGVASVEYYRSEEILTEDAVKAISEWTAYAPISETATDAEKFIYYVKITDNAGNETLFGSDGVTFDLTAPVIEGVTDGETYYTTQSVTVSDVNLQLVTLNTQSVGETFTLKGNTDAVYVIMATDKAGNSATYTLTMKPIASLAVSIQGITADNVTSANRAAIQEVKSAVAAVDTTDATQEERDTLNAITNNCAVLLAKITESEEEMAELTEAIGALDVDSITSDNKAIVKSLIERVDALLDGENLTAAERESVVGLKTECERLIEKIEESAQAGNTENTEKVEDITADNVKPEDKDDLTAAKEDLENALENFGDNYTEEEKATLEEKLEQINDALESIEKAEAIQDAISALPDVVEPDDTDTETLINAVKDQYDALTEHEKSLISEELKGKLESLLDYLVDYQIIEGNGSKWAVGDDSSITMTANGSVEKFVGIEVDGKGVDAENYTVKSGSTIITLKPAYLDTLSVGKHTLTLIYTDGEASGEFDILKDSETTTPGTGDNSNIALWVALMFIAACALTGTMFYRRRKNYNK